MSRRGRPAKHGLYIPRELVCPCGAAFTSHKPTARYCSEACRIRETGVCEVTHGLYLKRERTCPCGKVFEARKPGATYCSNECRVRIGRYGRTTYGGGRSA